MTDTNDALIDFISKLTDAIDKKKAEGERLSAVEAVSVALKSKLKDEIKSIELGSPLKGKLK